MNKEEFDRKLECLLPGGVLREEPMSKHTTFRIGGSAEWYVCPTVDVLPQVLALAEEGDMPLTVIGNGSNLLVADAGIRGIVLEIGRVMERVEIESADAIGNTETVGRELKSDQDAEQERKAEAGQEANAGQETGTSQEADAGREAEAGQKAECDVGANQSTSARMRIGAGTLLSKAARVAADAGLSGMEFAAGIPGSMGGAVVMNAGAYGGQMKDILTEVTVLTPDGKFLVCDIEELDLSYRHSIIPERHYIVVEAVVELTPAPKEEIQARMADLRQRRIDKQPLEFPSAGSTFKRPEGYFAGKLIQDAGLKGYTVGGAQVSPKHSGFVINTGNATAADVRQLITDVQERVMQQFGVMIEPEVRMLGDFAI